jgi:hypothetical protein
MISTCPKLKLLIKREREKRIGFVPGGPEKKN